MISTRRCISILMGLALGCSVMIATPSYAAPISWASWADDGFGNAVGTFDDGTTVTFAPSGDLNPAPQFGNTGPNYWDCATCNNGIYNNSTGTSEVDNSPVLTDIIRLTGGTGNLQSLTFSEGVTNPVMAILSLGRDLLPVDYSFNEPFTILNQGTGFWGGSGTALTQTGNTLTGNEGHGVIRFTNVDPITSITWTIPSPEFWHGFTVGKVATVPEPASLMLLGAGLAAIGIWRRKAAKV